MVAPSKEALGIALRVGVYALFSIAGLIFFPIVIFPIGGYFMAAVFGVFAAASVANAMALRIFDRLRLPAIGLYWTAGSGRNLLFGLGGGILAALLVLGGPILTGAASLVPDPQKPGHLGSVLLVLLSLIFGAVGEEMLFRGYGFQLLMGSIGRFATILPTAVLFAAVHAGNQNITWLGLINTAGFGVVLGYAVMRTGDLWMAIGIHLGWNWLLPLFGVNLSGFTMGLTGKTMRWNVGDLWSGGNYGPEASLLTCGIIVALMIFVAKVPAVEHELVLARPRPEA